MKKISVFVISLILVCMAVVPAFAEEFAYITDEAGLLTADQLSDLESRARRLSSQYGFDIAIVTTNNRGSTYMSDYADDFYDYEIKPFGYGSGNGVLLAIDMSDRSWYISTSGFGIAAFTDYGIEEAENRMAAYLGVGDYYNAFGKFLDIADSYYTQAKNGTPFDVPEHEFNVVTAAIVCLCISFIIALIVTGSMKSQLKSVRMQSSASQYTRSGSMQLTGSRDAFLYKNVTRSLRPQSTSSSGGSRSGGGSSTHISSSGSTHGGGGGHF